MRVVVVGLEFGAEFVPIYADHPDVTSVGIAAHESALRGGERVLVPDFE